MTEPTAAQPTGFVPLRFERLSGEEIRVRAAACYERYDRRRSVREFSTEAVPLEAIEDAIRAAGTAPSGAHHQPWHFVVVTDLELKQRIREAAEAEERESYAHRFPPEWLAALAPIGTDANKSHIEEAPVLIVVFAERTPPEGSGRKKNYYVTESVGIATGFLIAALHEAGLATLTHTPNPMNFLRDLLGRPKSEHAFVLLPVGYPAEGAQVPDFQRKPLSQIMSWFGPGAET